MANTTVVQITNTTTQTIGIMVNSIAPDKSNAISDIPAQKDGSYHMVAGSSLTVELQRISVGQLDNLRNLGQITYS